MNRNSGTCKEYKNSKKIEFIIGDIRDYTNLNNSMKGADYVVHAAEQQK